jgi:hypothetical protein
VKRGLFDRKRLTAISALERCPVLGLECVEAARTMLSAVRVEVLIDANAAFEREVPRDHRLRQKQIGPQTLHPDLFTQDGAVRETVRKLLKALDQSAPKQQVVADRSGLTLEVVKGWWKTLQIHGLIARNDARDWVRTPEGDRLRAAPR